MSVDSDTAKIVGPKPAAALALGAGPMGAHPVPDDPDARVVLRAERTRLGKLIFLAIFTIIWNGVTGTFVVISLSGGGKGGVLQIGLGCFLVPFVLIGLAVIVGFLHTLLGLTNPRPVLTVSRAGVRPGEPFTLAWSLGPRGQRVRRLAITIRGLESATYQRGTDTHTDEHVFHEFTVCDHRSDGAFRTTAWDDEAKVVIPAGMMHTFEAPRNAVRWTVSVAGEIPRWPDIDDAFVLTVLPSEARA
ncbi:MAG: hypothetical protein KDA25_10310 [Phycisphaerales bacterium]|nr:hypothetical protein [Phycisphaerales bacterium]